MPRTEINKLPLQTFFVDKDGVIRYL